ncbi:MAG TPA: DUF4912 domain-containing protein [Pyrinomonadaceae bacterium]|jgi:hypothetical protein
MNETEINNLPENEAVESESETREFVFDAEKINSASSAEMIKTEDASAEENTPEIPLEAKIVNEEAEAAEEEIEEEDPIFKELSEPRLPRLEKENRARLQMQSPNRIFFYWSMKNNPYQTLNRALGNQTGSYTLVAKLINQTQEREELFPVEAEGDWWFDTDTDSTYRAEIGFYAPNRPFIRILNSNTIETPRKSPSPRRAAKSDWAVSANQFARVLDVAGFAQDAFEVAFAGDDTRVADSATESAFSQLVGAEQKDSVRHDLSEVRFALLALASGIELEKLRGQISLSLYRQMLQNAEKLSAQNALNALEENFGEFAEETEERLPTVFGASLINFPRKLKRKVFPKFSPISSLKS